MCCRICWCDALYDMLMWWCDVVYDMLMKWYDVLYDVMCGMMYDMWCMIIWCMICDVWYRYVQFKLWKTWKTSHLKICLMWSSLMNLSGPSVIDDDDDDGVDHDHDDNNEYR